MEEGRRSGERPEDRRRSGEHTEDRRRSGKQTEDKRRTESFVVVAIAKGDADSPSFVKREK
ncbi:hypothetical protein F2Q70_00035188 [Brassica cretica]|uniref:Uncharacterized protein n=1 Tax=Brassica cretica TaxID=69181 RepID=A0A8S9JTB8_BRACR|nr:hypothetical protein F2Q70_00035188 [Brassica cretica]KAF3603612.1 hypothetical protein F2Q69_00034160 [Brassica cretica]